MQYHNQEPPASSKAPNENIIDMEVISTFQINLEWDKRSIKSQGLYSSHDQDAKPKSESFSLL